jgi:hypothetical protein
MRGKKSKLIIAESSKLILLFFKFEIRNQFQDNYLVRLGSSNIYKTDLPSKMVSVYNTLTNPGPARIIRDRRNDVPVQDAGAQMEKDSKNG